MNIPFLSQLGRVCLDLRDEVVCSIHPFDVLDFLITIMTVFAYVIVAQADFDAS